MNKNATNLLKVALIRTLRTACFTAAAYFSSCTILADFKLVDFGFNVLIASGICFVTCIAGGLPEEEPVIKQEK